MLTLAVRHDDPTDVDPGGELTRLAGELERRWPDLPAPLVLDWSDQPVLALDRDVPWLYGPVAKDPLTGPDGVAVLPRRARRQLAERAATGPRFPALAIAHELDPAGPVEALLPLLRQGPRTCTDAVARQLVGPVPGHPGVVRAAGLFDAVLGGRAAAHALDLLLDPIVFGVVAPSALVHGTRSLWYPLAAWRW